MSDELSRAAATIERLQWEMHELQAEIARLTIRNEEGAGDLAYRLATTCIYEATQEAIKRYPRAKIITIHVDRDFLMTINDTRYVVRVRETQQ